ARHTRGRLQAAAPSTSGSIASWASVPESGFEAGLADALCLGAADLDRENLRIRGAPVPGARTAKERDRTRLGEGVRELEVVRLARAVRPQAAVRLVLTRLRGEAASRGVLRIALQVDLREDHV